MVTGHPPVHRLRRNSNRRVHWPGGQTDKTETNLTESSVSDADEDTEAILDGVITEEVTTEGLPEKQKKEAVKLIKRFYR